MPLLSFKKPKRDQWHENGSSFIILKFVNKGNIVNVKSYSACSL